MLSQTNEYVARRNRRRESQTGSPREHNLAVSALRPVDRGKRQHGHTGAGWAGTSEAFRSTKPSSSIFYLFRKAGVLTVTISALKIDWHKCRASLGRWGFQCRRPSRAREKGVEVSSSLAFDYLNGTLKRERNKSKKCGETGKSAQMSVEDLTLFPCQRNR